MATFHVRLTAAAIRGIAQCSPGSPVRFAAGLASQNERVEILVASTNIVGRVDPADAVVVATVRERQEDWQPLLQRLLNTVADTHHVVVGLVVGVGAAAGALAALARTRSSLHVVERVAIVGPGLPSVNLSQPAVTVADVARIRANQPREAADLERWSRTAGALGRDTWQHLRHQHVAVVGCGRSGSLVATALARSGFRRLTLIDPDRIELHNLGEMDAVTLDDYGSAKVDSIASSIRRQAQADIATVTAGIETVRAFRTATTADVLFGCADHPEARLLTSAIGAIFLRPVVDIGTGIFGEGPGRRMGADVRLLLPGTCLACYGGLAPPREVPLAPPPGVESDWRRQRAGSLRSLNQIAVGLGLRLLEDLVQGRTATSVWLHLEFGTNGVPRLDRVRTGPRSGCLVCALAGRGDGALTSLPRALHEVMATSSSPSVPP